MTIGELEQRAGIGQSHEERFAFWIAFSKAADPVAAGCAVLHQRIAAQEATA